jgi:hypothetical protein
MPAKTLIFPAECQLPDGSVQLISIRVLPLSIQAELPQALPENTLLTLIFCGTDELPETLPAHLRDILRTLRMRLDAEVMLMSKLPDGNVLATLRVCDIGPEDQELLQEIMMFLPDPEA